MAFFSVTAAPSAPTLSNPATFETDASAILAWVADFASDMVTAKLVQQSGILGTVAQSGGLPTGALIERGSNPNGQYTRLADGTQVCFQNIDDTAGAWATASGGVFARSSAISWTFPALFSAAPRVMADALVVAISGRGANANTISASTANLIPWSSVSLAAATAKSLDLIAIGRWY